MQTVKNLFPFIIGTTSYIIPDDILPNVRMLASIVDDVELVLFESPDISNIPTEDAIKELADIGREQALGYTVHLPTDKKAGASDLSERLKFCDAAKTVIDRCLPLSPRAWILHLEGVDINASSEDVAIWQDRCSGVVETLGIHLGTSSKLAIENLGYPWRWHQELAVMHKTSICCDVGHLWMLFSHGWHEHLKAMLPYTTVIHVHGVCNGKDHISLAAGDATDQKIFFETLLKEKYHGVVTLEIFNETDFCQSAEVIKKIWEQLH